MYKTHQHLQRSRPDGVDFSQFERSSQKTDFQRPPRYSHRRGQIGPATSSPTLSSQQFHLPFKTSPAEHSDSSHFSAQETETDKRDSTISMSFPTFANLSHSPHLIDENDRPTEQPDDWQTETHDKAAGRPPSPILTEIPGAHTNFFVQNTEWTTDKDGAESDFEHSKVDFITNDRPHFMNSNTDIICLSEGY